MAQNSFQKMMDKGGPSDADMGAMPNVNKTGLNTKPSIPKKIQKVTGGKRVRRNLAGTPVVGGVQGRNLA
jgi:hypothetical protein